MLKMIFDEIEQLDRKTVFSSFLVLEVSLRKNSVIPRSALRVMIYVQEDFISN